MQHVQSQQPSAQRLVFLTDIEGVFVDPTDKSTLISEMDINEAQEFIDSGVVGGGMLPKLTNCIEAMKNGVARVHMLDGRVEHCLLLEFFTEKGIGTAILKGHYSKLSNENEIIYKNYLYIHFVYEGSFLIVGNNSRIDIRCVDECAGCI